MKASSIRVIPTQSTLLEKCAYMRHISIKTRGYVGGVFELKSAWDGPVLAAVQIRNSNVWEKYTAELDFPDGKQSLYLTYRGNGQTALKSICFKES